MGCGCNKLKSPKTQSKGQLIKTILKSGKKKIKAFTVKKINNK